MRATSVGLAEWKVTNSSSELLCAIGLGSSIALFIYDPDAHVAALAHIMLPAGRDADRSPAKYVDSAVPFLLQQVVDAGGSPTGLRVALFGGATMLLKGHSALLEIGQRNVAAAMEALSCAGLTPVVVDVGGTKGRTVSLNVGTGEITVKVLGEPDRHHAELVAGTEVPS